MKIWQLIIFRKSPINLDASRKLRACVTNPRIIRTHTPSILGLYIFLPYCCSQARIWLGRHYLQGTWIQPYILNIFFLCPAATYYYVDKSADIGFGFDRFYQTKTLDFHSASLKRQRKNNSNSIILCWLATLEDVSNLLMLRSCQWIGLEMMTTLKFSEKAGPLSTKDCFLLRTSHS